MLVALLPLLSIAMLGIKSERSRQRPFSFQLREQHDEKGNYTIVFPCLPFSRCFALSSLNIYVVLKLLISKTNKFGLRYNKPTLIKSNWS